MRLKLARAKLHEIVNHANADPQYRKQLQEAPISVLVKGGLPYDLIEDFLREADWQGEVSGYSLPDCANTCALTRLNAYPEGFLSSFRETPDI